MRRVVLKEEVPMAKETKIGLSVVAVLTCVLAGVAVKRFVLTGPAGPAVAPMTAASEPAPLPADEKPTVVMAQKGAASFGQRPHGR